ncbi:hypothetical protein DERP_000138 [Dermatophagoides pteronyssinus]|uniref:Uncharacterized protein n=1 Tax=Dermatophagoides pteronyssinus TaxID=6956 RepID=A0ABQ8IZ94_DERPT|nr:hypothetical protein DERP_000138 [Dermatophagoides pteronyssinus]
MPCFDIFLSLLDSINFQNISSRLRFTIILNLDESRFKCGLFNAHTQNTNVNVKKFYFLIITTH